MKYLANVASLVILPERCTGCGMCVDVCPHEVFSVHDKRATILDKDRCMECGACANNCAFGALKVDKGVGCAAALINGMVTGGEPSCGCGGETGTNGCC